MRRTKERSQEKPTGSPVAVPAALAPAAAVAFAAAARASAAAAAQAGRCDGCLQSVVISKCYYKNTYHIFYYSRMIESDDLNKQRIKKKYLD